MTANITVQTPEQTIQSELRLRGIGLIIAGLILFIFWRDGIMSLAAGVLGILNLLFPRRPMFAVNGVVFILVALLNVLSGIGNMLLAGSGLAVNGPVILGMLQFGWGAQEFEKFSKFGPKTPEYQLLIKKLNSPYETTRATAAQELGKLDFSNEEIIRELRAATQDEYNSVRRAAAEALKASAHATFLTQTTDEKA